MQAWSMPLLTLVLFSGAGCVTEPAPRVPIDGPSVNDERSARGKLATVGVRVIDPFEANLPPDEITKVIPCRVDPRVEEPALPPHPAGYLLVGVDGEICSPARIWQELETWTRARPIRLVVRRNPHLPFETEWWEAEVTFALP